MQGTMRERRPGVWELRVYVGKDQTGRPRQVSRTFRGGKRAAQRELAGMVVNKPDAPVTKDTVAHFLRTWQAERRVRSERDPTDISPSTVAGDEVTIERWLIPAIGDIPLRKLGPADLDAMYAQWREKGSAQGSILRRHATLSGALGRAVRWGWIADNPASKADPGKLRPLEIVPPTVEEVQRLIAAATERNPILGRLFFVAAVTGCRRGELCGLRWSRVDLDSGIIIIASDGNAVTVRGKTIVKDPKNHKARRVSIDAVLVELFRAHRTWLEEKAGHPMAPDSFVFSQEPDGRVPYKPTLVTRFFERTRERLSLEHVNLHHLRHFSTTALLSRPGARLAVVAGRQGHSEQVMVGTYFAFLDGADREEAAFMGELLSGQKSAPARTGTGGGGEQR